MPDSARLVCIMGSGETAPTMVSVHQDLIKRVGSPPGPALLLDTPYGFEENAAGITARAQKYFERNVGHPIDVVPVPAFERADELTLARLANAIRDSRYLFAGPGSPSYALRQWRESVVPPLLVERLQSGGCVTFASAAATTLGRSALPVYEIYKVGEAPHWLDGLDILETFELSVAVLPHYDNTQGGTHDTRFCFMGERRLLDLEGQLEPGVAILGVAEHTAAILDRDSDQLTVRGRGFVAIRHAGVETRFQAGESVPLARLRQSGSKEPRVPPPVVGPAGVDASVSGRFEAALAHGDTPAALVILLEAATRLENLEASAQATDHSEFRRILVRFAEAAQAGADSGESIAPFVELALELRDAARRDGRFLDADLVRDRLVALGIEIRDTPDGTRWSPPARG